MGIYVWGTGCGAAELIERGLPPERIAAFVDSFSGSREFMGRPVILPAELDIADCGLLIVTTRHVQPVADACDRQGIPPEKRLFLKNSVTLWDRNGACTAAEALLGRPLLEKLLPKQRAVTTPAQLAVSALPKDELSGDYVRLASLELLCRRLSGVPGAAAELGVYRGDFARCVNRLLPDRALYLFDSFAGFMPEDGASDAFQAAHANTAVERVLAGMPYPERLRLRPGFFPASVNGLEERFCFVSLDVDFFSTTLEGLRYFWPRLETGGYLMLHDWGNPGLPGVAQALERYEAELGHPIPAVPLCDLTGTLVLPK